MLTLKGFKKKKNEKDEEFRLLFDYAKVRSPGLKHCLVYCGNTEWTPGARRDDAPEPTAGGNWRGFKCKGSDAAKHKKIVIKNTSVSDHWPAVLCILSEEAAGSGKNP